MSSRLVSKMTKGARLSFCTYTLQLRTVKRRVGRVYISPLREAKWQDPTRPSDDRVRIMAVSLSLSPSLQNDSVRACACVCLCERRGVRAIQCALEPRETQLRGKHRCSNTERGNRLPAVEWRSCPFRARDCGRSRTWRGRYAIYSWSASLSRRDNRDFFHRPVKELVVFISFFFGQLGQAEVR